MSYIVFARKWRPRTFEDVVGQEHITVTLKKAIEKNRVAHAYIFTGTRGVGKTTTARILARALNCEKGPTPLPCGECTSCKGIGTGSSFDVLEIDGASNNSVDNIRELRENVGYSSMGGKYRIYVIDEVHMLSNAAFNALLKTLEEPPKNVIFIFATTEPHKIPATIHSRCQRYDFRRISSHQILERLTFICDEEKIDYERAALALIAQKADGSMRDALSLLDQVYSFCQDSISEKEARLVLGLVGMEVYSLIMDAVADKKPSVVLGVVQDVLQEGYDLQEFILGLQEHLRNLLFARIPDALSSVGSDLEKETVEMLIRSAKRFSEGDLLRMTEIVRRTEHDLKWSVFPRFLVEIMLLKMVYLDRTVSIEQMVKLFGGQKNGACEDLTVKLPEGGDTAEEIVKKKLLTQAPQPLQHHLDQVRNTITPVAEKASTTSQDGPVMSSPTDEALCASIVTSDGNSPKETSSETDDISSLWPSFLELLLRDRPKLGSFLSLATVAASSPRSIDLKFSPSLKFQFQELNRKPNREELSRMLRTFTGRPIDLRMTLESYSPDGIDRKYINPSAAAAPTINDEIEREPIIRSVLDMFDGEVIE